jgi:UDP-glucose 4-epimerase
MLNKKVLVTGGSGFIGSAVVDSLIVSGYHPFIIDKKINPWTKNLSGCQYVESTVQDFFKENKLEVEAVIHMAASHIVSESIINSLEYYDNNINSLLSVLKGVKTKKIIFSSSAALYGLGGEFKEDSPTGPINPYGRSKLWCEDILKDHGINHISLRYFNAAGAGKNHGYIQKPATHIVPILMDSLFFNKELKVYGNKYKTRDGTCERDYCHVMDIADAHIKALSYDGDYRVINIGSGSGITILELIDRAEAVTGKRLKWSYGKARRGDPSRLVADISLAKKELDWVPNNSINIIMKDVWNWINSAY